MRQFSIVGAQSFSTLAAGGAKDMASLITSAQGLAFAMNPLAGAIGLAVGSIATAWLTARKEAKKHQDDILKDHKAFLDKLREQQEQGIFGQTPTALASVRAENATLLASLAEVQRQIANAHGPVFTGAGGGVVLPGTDVEGLKRQSDAIVAQLVANQKRIGAGERELTRITKEEADKQAKAFQQAYDKRQAEARKNLEFMKSLVSDDVIVDKLKKLLGDDGIKRTSILDDIADASKKLGDEFKREIGPAADAYLEALREVERVTQQIAKNQANMALGTIFGAMGQHGGAFGGILSGAGFGFLSGGGPGAAIGAIGGLIGAMDMLGNSAAEQRREMEALQRQYDSFTDGIKEQLGVMTPLEARSRAAAREFAAMRDAIVSEGALSAFEEFGEVMLTAGVITQDQIEKVGALNTLERQYLDLLKKQEQQRINDIGQESAILRLRIQGQDELADGMQRTIEKQNELRDALAAGASQAEITAIKERQRLEDILKAVEQTQERIASFAATIANLQAFRNALLLSPDAGLSPTQQLAEARRQYEDILTKALGGDQQAAGMLSGAAQTLLQFSRAVNASGPSFQDDLAKVLADNAAVIAKFEDLKTIEELMLEQLRQIAEDTGNLTGRSGSDPNRPNDPRDHGLHHLMQEGFVALRDEVALLRSEVREQTQVNKNGFDGWITLSAN